VMSPRFALSLLFPIVIMNVVATTMGTQMQVAVHDGSNPKKGDGQGHGTRLRRLTVLSAPHRRARTSPASAPWTAPRDRSARTPKRSVTVLFLLI
jgi:hypothetical protein